MTLPYELSCVTLFINSYLSTHLMCALSLLTLTRKNNDVRDSYILETNKAYITKHT